MAEESKSREKELPESRSTADTGNESASGADESTASAPNRPSVIPLSYGDKDSLQRAYMPFVKGGGLFLPTSKTYELNDEVFLLVTLPNSKKPIPVPGRVVWQTPAGAIDSRRQGIGIEFKGREGNGLRNLIEGQLGARVSSPSETYTM